MGKQSERRTVRYLPQVLLVTGLMLGAPVALAWGLVASGAITSLPLLIAIAVSAALLLGHTGAAIWKRRPRAGDMLFGELLVWGWLRRLWSERRLANALRTMGTAAGAGELDAAQQAERLERLIAALESSDPYTHGHSQRVARYSATIARRLHLPAEQVARIRTAAAVHDVGKVNTPPEVLRKRGGLTDEEFEAIKRHPVDGARMVEALGDSELTRSVLHHHERLDGTGYPKGISGEEIPIGSRIIAVADTFDAIASARPYRNAKTHREALEVLAAVAGAQLDPEAVQAFRSHYSDSRPLAVGTALVSVPERMASFLGGSVNAASSAVAGVAVAVVAGVGAAIIDQPPESADLGSRASAAAQPALSPALKGASPDSQQQQQQRDRPFGADRRKRAASGPPASGRAATPGSPGPTSPEAMPASSPPATATDAAQPVAAPPPSSPAPTAEPGQERDGSLAPPPSPSETPPTQPPGRPSLLERVLALLPDLPEVGR